MRRAPIVAGLAALALLPVGLGLVAPGTPGDVAAWLSALCEGQGAAGPALLVAAQTLIAASGVLPASLLGIAAGTLLGIGPGFATAAAGTMAGALLSFWIGRVLLRGRGSGLLARRGWTACLDRSVAAEGWRLVCLMRLSPVMPFAPTSYALSLSSVRLADYLVGTLAALPALLAYVMLGALGRTALAGEAEWLRGGVLVVGLGATGLLLRKLKRLARTLPPGSAREGEPP
ncbi:TVP38/TMEM64 family protein [Methylobacterium nonmethylotrophicum]|uniref:TVP38/TMEM64 family membrane protein n=1 Tax=Methylobacterium nonmethylotrophicum TaxID=1141884 RepID=A0A4Z0NR99_9HYPH|nr:VTT domain-containing protein [Methylobacterium nonmethylotrophicum]TGD99379.1 TVP38/TMEM64 family protein [Methylobacterium nonmethylotrophicum]